MRFAIENFGPIEKADITLKDLNVFIGKNSSGKSYLVYLIWALLSVEPDWKKIRALFDEYVPNELIREAMEESDDKEKSEIETKLADGFRKVITEAFNKFEVIWGKNLEELIKDTFFVDDINELLRTGYESSKIIISNDAGDEKIHLEINEGLRAWVDTDVIRTIEENIITIVTADRTTGGSMFLHIAYIGKEPPEKYVDVDEFTQNYEAYWIIPTTFTWIFDGYSPHNFTFIAPDGRTGLIRSLEAYNYALISGKVTINEVDRLFMRDYTSLYLRVVNEDISKFAEFIESKLNVKFVLRREQPRYTIQVEDLEIPLQRAPSGYRELAPLIYAMRYKLDRDHIIFIEEPEAHLHPDGEVVAIRALAGLSNYCYVVLTTHSITILDEISNLLKLKNIPVEEKIKLGYEEWEGLSPESVGIFLVKDGKVEEIEVYEDGIEESDLDRIVVEIANLHAKVEAEYEHSRRLQTQR